MTSYNIAQHVNYSSITPTSTGITIRNQSYPVDYSDDKMQQIVITGFNFSINKCYLIRITIPQNQNYDLNYGIRLINNSSNTNTPVKDRDDYQFIKYISVPKYNNFNVDVSTIWLYVLDDNMSAVKAAIAEPLPAPNDTSKRANKIYYGKVEGVDTINYYDDDGNIVSKTWDGVTTNNWYGHLYKNITTLAHNFDDNRSAPWTNEFLVVPNNDNFNAIYLYLKPIDADRDMRWDNNTMMGRYTDISNITVAYAEIPTNEVQDIDNVVNIGVWGRSEQLMAINGQEIKIGPSGYYELRDYDISSLYIANTEENDRYTVDIQYSN